MTALWVVVACIAAGLALSMLLTWFVRLPCNGCGRRKITVGGLCIDCVLDEGATDRTASSRCIRCGMYVPDTGSLFCVPCKEEKTSGR